MLHRSQRLQSGLSRPLVVACVAMVMLTALCAAGLRRSTGDPIVLAQADPQAAGASKEIALSLKNLKRIVRAMHDYHDRHKHFPPAVVLGPDGKTPHSWRVELLPELDQKHLYDRYRMNEQWDSPHNKQLVERMPDVFRSPYDDPRSTNSGYYVLVGRGTLFEAAKTIAIQDIKDGASNTLIVVESKRRTPWTKPDDILDPDKALPEIGGFVDGRFNAALADGSVWQFEMERVRDQLKWLITRNDQRAIDWNALGFERRVPQPAALLPRRNPRGDQALLTKDNLKSLNLAMHVYHDVHRHFPPAVVMGPDGKTPHSWRVELLPYLDHKPLYDQYRLNEPWDSPANLTVLAQVPDLFHSPYDDPKSPYSGYYALVGPGTVFEGAAGIRNRDIIDGVRNTLLIVEAKRNIPWTKPEDIPFDPNEPLPELGGFIKGKFAAVMADNAVHVFDTAKTKDQLKWLILRNDHHPIDWNKFNDWDRPRR